MVVRYTAIFFGEKGQAAVEYLVLLVIFALLTIISVSIFFAGDKNLHNSLRDNFFAPAVRKILE